MVQTAESPGSDDHCESHLIRGLKIVLTYSHIQCYKAYLTWCLKGQYHEPGLLSFCVNYARIIKVHSINVFTALNNFISETVIFIKEKYNTYINANLNGKTIVE